MQISILSPGTRGDTQPYISLGVALKKAGHSVRLAAFENYASFVESYGLGFSPIRGDVTAYISGDVAQEAVKADNPLKFLLTFNKMLALASDLQPYFFDACQGADVVVYHPGAAIGYFIAQELNVPSVLATPNVGLQVMPSVIYKQSQVAVKYLRKLMGKKVFENPKDYEVIARLIRYVTKPGEDVSIFYDKVTGPSEDACFTIPKDIW
jgi:UDP:flavonoid glycosyltransferase YjiC (YdhE family)